MPRATANLLSRFGVLQTTHLAEAREETSRFWPSHSSVVLGPDDYSLILNRVELGSLAVTFVDCTSRIRVVSKAATPGYSLYVPLLGNIRIVADGFEMMASPGKPLLRGPARTFVFEPSPIRCLVVDIPESVMKSMVGRSAAAPTHTSLASPAGASLARQAVELAKAANRSPAVVALQGFSARDRGVGLSDRIRLLERELLESTVRAGATRWGEVGCDVDVLKRWLASHAHRRVRMAELAALAGVSQRTVERAFLRIGETPLDYLRKIRLERARTMLTGPMENGTVAAVATAVGYSHHGRFADEYRAHYGELPSQALARAQEAAKSTVDGQSVD